MIAVKREREREREGGGGGGGEYLIDKVEMCTFLWLVPMLVVVSALYFSQSVMSLL